MWLAILNDADERAKGRRVRRYSSPLYVVVVVVHEPGGAAPPPTALVADDGCEEGAH